MSFPVSPLNSQIAYRNGIQYIWVEADQAWYKLKSTSANVITTDTANIVSNTSSTSTTTGALKVAGGLGVAGNIFAGSFYSDNYFLSNGAPLSTAGAIGYTGSAGADGTIGVDGYTGSTGYTGSVGLTNWQTITANYTATAGDRLMLDSTAGEFYLTLPATPTSGSYIQATDVGDLSANAVVIDLNGSTLEGNTAPLSLDLSYTTYELIYDGTTWHITSTTGAQGATGYTGSAGIGGLATWQIVTANYTAVNGDRIFVDTSTANITITLPSSATLSNEVTIVDAESNAANNNITVARNGSNINGLAEDLIIDVNASATTLTYYNTSRGWVITS